MIEHLLIPTDFSETAAAAAEYGCELAAQLGARVTLLSVFSSEVVGLPEAMYAPTEEELRVLAHTAHTHLSGLAYKLARAGLQIDCVVVEGEPAESVTRWATEHHADLIVMGTHGRSGLSHALLGSVAERVLRGAPCPVLTVGRASKPHAQLAAL